VKTASAETVDGSFRVWCDRCSIRIAPSEERVAVGAKVYHSNCHSKLAKPKSKRRAAAGG
jgi:hypothetical protein